MDVEGVVKDGLKAVDQLSEAASFHSGIKICIQPAKTALPQKPKQVVLLKAEMEESVHTLKTHNCIFGTPLTVDKILDLVEERDVGDLESLADGSIEGTADKLEAGCMQYGDPTSSFNPLGLLSKYFILYDTGVLTVVHSNVMGVTFMLEGKSKIGVIYFLQVQSHQNSSPISLAVVVVSRYSDPNLHLLEESSRALYSCKYLGGRSITMILAISIEQIVSMNLHQVNNKDCLFMFKKPGNDVISLGDLVISHEDNEDVDSQDDESGNGDDESL
ncbi:hypothetical protein BS17DRAFT_769892 [Gyrodon lividus]|nr:hypothetical protein BS17DRAFT_769892 [Gyrodon lividus]